MSFRKRNAVVSSPGATPDSSCDAEKGSVSGVRPSPLDGRLTTSTGTRSLDALLAGHAGLALGTSLLIEENGTTDFGGVLLRYFAAEGIVQGHHVHVFGMNESWGRNLPGFPGAKESTSGRNNEEARAAGKMKIAWRYERLGEFGRDKPLVTSFAEASTRATKQQIFCHDFDLSKRLVLLSPSLLNFVPPAPQMAFGYGVAGEVKSPFLRFTEHLISQLSNAPKSSIHRIVMPDLLSPAVYVNNATVPESFLQFLHSLRALLRKYPSQLVAAMTLPLTLHPRQTGLTRWAELLSDGVIELAPFPSQLGSVLPTSLHSVGAQDETPQGMLKIHHSPILHERGGGGSESSGFGDDLAFTLSGRRGLVLKPFSLPPVDGDANIQHGGMEDDGGKALRPDIEF